VGDLEGVDGVGTIDRGKAYVELVLRDSEAPSFGGTAAAIDRTGLLVRGRLHHRDGRITGHIVGDPAVLGATIEDTSTGVSVDVEAVRWFPSGRLGPATTLGPRQREAVEVALEPGDDSLPRETTPTRTSVRRYRRRVPGEPTGEAVLRACDGMAEVEMGVDPLAADVDRRKRVGVGPSVRPIRDEVEPADVRLAVTPEEAATPSRPRRSATVRRRSLSALRGGPEGGARGGRAVNAYMRPDRTGSRMWSDDAPSQPDWLERAYELLRARVREDDQALTRERATDVLVADGDVAETPADAEHALERLLDSGRLYEVGGELRVTDADE